MFKNSKVIVIATVLTTLLSAIPMYASVTTDTGTTETSSVKHSQSRPDNNGFKSKLDSLVKAGTLSSDQETAIQNALKPDQAQKPASQGEKPQMKGNGVLSTVLDSLVADETITADQQTAIKTALQNALETAKDSKTTSEKGHASIITNVLDTLVTANTITSDQEAAIKSAMEAARPAKTDNTGDDQQRKSGMTNRLTAALEKLVTAGTITAEQEETIISTLTSN